jgi:Glycosyl transferase family 2
MTISLLVPTRGRPANIRRFVESARSTASASIEIIFYIDDDDPEPSVNAAREADTLIVLGPRIILSECWNQCAKQATGDILGHFGDDIIFRTERWDVMIEAEFAKKADKILFVHGRDGHHDAGFGTHGFIHRRWMETVGYFVPPLFSSDWNDAWLNEIANILGRRVSLQDLYTEHMHYVFGKAPYDDTYAEREARGDRDDCKALFAATADLRIVDAEKLRAVMA